MNCMKCGVEIDSTQVFCEACLADMKRFPVKPGTRIQLPNRPVMEVVKKQPSKKRRLTEAEKIHGLRQIINWLSVALVAALLLLGFAISLLLDEPGAEDSAENIGQNYNTIGENSAAD